MPQKFVREAQFLAPRAVTRRQEIARETRLHGVKLVARDGLRDLAHQRMLVAMEPFLQRLAPQKDADSPGNSLAMMGNHGDWRGPSQQ